MTSTHIKIFSLRVSGRATDCMNAANISEISFDIFDEEICEKCPLHLNCGLTPYLKNGEDKVKKMKELLYKEPVEILVEALL